MKRGSDRDLHAGSVLIRDAREDRPYHFINRMRCHLAYHKYRLLARCAIFWYPCVKILFITCLQLLLIMHTTRHRRWALAATLVLSATTSLWSQGESLKTGIVAHWPLDEIQGTAQLITPDLKNNYDLQLFSLSSSSLIDEGKRGKAIRMSGGGYLSRRHGATDDLPANKHDSFTVSFWIKANFNNAADARMFAETNRPLISGGAFNNDPLITLGTHSGFDSRTGMNTNPKDAGVDMTIRHAAAGGAPADPQEHYFSEAKPLDGVDWHHIVLRQTIKADFSATREIFVDGVKTTVAKSSAPTEQVELPDRPATPNGILKPYDINATSFGAVVRGNPIAVLPGDIDDIAIWKRALTQAEINDVRDNGIPSLVVVLEPLAVKSFVADFPRVAAGRDIRLQWEVTKDATAIEVTPAIDGLTDLISLSSVGVGSVKVAVTAPVTYTLKARRGAEVTAGQSVTIGVVPGVAEGWDLVDTFEAYDPAPLAAQGGWFSGPENGVYEIVTQGNTKALAPTAGDDLAGRTLGALSIADRSTGTLFFRFCYSDQEAELPLLVKAGLTDKSLRRARDFIPDAALVDPMPPEKVSWSNIGAYITLSKPAAGEPLKILAVDGLLDDGNPQMAQVPTAADFPLTANQVYNVWIDLTNNARPAFGLLNESTDTFSVHIAPEGTATRTTLFTNFVSDRTTEFVFGLNSAQAAIDQVFVAAPTADQGSRSLLVDDVFVSSASFLETVPLPSTFGKVVVVQADPNFRILSATYSTAPSPRVRLQWASRVGESYTISTSPDLQVWSPARTDIPATDLTTSSELLVTGGGKRFYRIIKQR